MGTIVYPNQGVDITGARAAKKTQVTFLVSNWAIMLGRIFFSSIFVLSAFHHFSNETVNYAVDQGVPMAGFFVPFSGLMALAGGLSILFGYKEKIGALLLMLFLIPVTIKMHNFWAVTDPGLAQMQMAHFMKNTALFGALVLIYQYSPNPFAKKT